MTRLTQNDIKTIPDMLDTYDDKLLSITGLNLAGIACRAFGLARSAFTEFAAGIRVGVIPITWGQGMISGFSETVQAIIEHLGFTAFVTHETDVAGLSETAVRGADMILLSDDEDFQAIHLKAGISVHNSTATGQVFAAGLDLMAQGIKGKKALVVGCGPVGQKAGQELLQRGARLAMVDVDLEKTCHVAQVLTKQLNTAVSVVTDIEQALTEYEHILDASPAADIIDVQHVIGNTLISAPGVPLGLTPQAVQAASGRLLHDTLQLGVAAMMAAIIKKLNVQ
jgi:pyrrolysine biosynthesis protein PylD